MWDTGDQPYPLDPSVIAHIQGGGAWTPPPMDAAPALAPLPAQLHPDVIQGVQNGFAPGQPPIMSMPSLHPDVVQSVQGGSPQPQQVPDFASPSAADHALVAKQDAARAALAAKHEADQQKLEAKHQGEVAKYLATPEGKQEAAVQGEMKIDQQRADAAVEQGAAQKQQSDAEALLRQQQIDATQQQQAKHANDVAEQQRQAMQLHGQYAQAAEAAAKKTVDPNRMWADKSTGAKIASIFGILLSGVGQGLSGGRGQNLALEQINKSIDADIDAQKANISQANKGVDMKHDVEVDYGHLTDDVNAQWTARQAEGRIKAADQLLQQAAQFKGTQQYADAVDLSQKLKSDAFVKLGSLATQQVAQKHQAAELANQRRATDIAGGHLALASRANDRDDKKFTWDMEKDKAELELKAAALTAKGKKPDAEQLQKFGVAGVTYKDKDGDEQQFIAQGTPEGVEKVRETKTAGTNMVGLIDEALRLRSGWTTKTGNSEEWQKLQAIWAAAKGEGKNVLGLGALSESDFALLDSYMGTADPTKFRDPTSGMKQARKNIIRKVNATLHGHGLPDGQDWDIPDLQSNAPKETADDLALGRVMADPYHEGDPEEIAADLGGTPTALGGRGPDAAEAQKKWNDNGGMLTGMRETLDNFAAMAKSSDPKIRDLGVANLSNASEKAALPGVKKYAQQLLTSNIKLSSSSEPTAEPTSRNAARDTSYGGTP